MCFHKSFENVTLKSRDIWYNDPDLEYTKQTYCDGSRNHGCQGCFCRHPELMTYRGTCGKCGKMMYELLDLLWDIRRQIYKEYVFRELGWIELVRMEWEAEERLYNEIFAMKLPLTMPRSDLLRIHGDTAKKIVAKVIDDEMNDMYTDS